MNQLATIPIWIWSLWTLGIILFVWGLLIIKKIMTSDDYVERPLALRGTALAIGGVLVGGSGLILDTFHAQEEQIKQVMEQAVEQDPALARMASTAEALGWMEEEVEPLVLELGRETGRVKWAKQVEASAIAEIEKINAKLEEKEREFEQRFGHLAPPTERAEGRSLSPLMIDPNAVYTAGKK